MVATSVPEPAQTRKYTAYALDGKMEEAMSALAEARRLNPQLTLKLLQTNSLSIPPLLEGLRKAGLLEG
jgi:hypothetical protein